MSSSHFKNMTAKQLQIMRVITAGSGKDETGQDIPVDMDELLARLPYKTSKESMQFSIRALIRHDYITKSIRDYRRGRSRVCFHVTPTGASMVTSSVPVSFVTPPGVEEILGDSESI